MKVRTRVETAAAALLAKRRFVAPLELFTALGWLPDRQLDRWRRGQVEHLGVVLAVTPDKAREALEVLRRWAESQGLESSEVEYPAATLDRRPLRFGEPESAYRTHWLAAGLSDAKRESLLERQNKAPDLMVDVAAGDWECAECRGTGDLLVADPGGPVCLVCADLDHLVFLGAGDAALTRRAKKASGLSAVVRRYDRSRKRFQRTGILVEEAALEQAEDSCLADTDVRLRRRERDRERRAVWDVDFQAALGREVLRLFPCCPPERAEAIARHAGTRGSGRVGRSAAGRALDERKTTLAVIASLRHEDTDYDSMLMSGVDRAVARERIRADIDRLLENWRG